MSKLSNALRMMEILHSNGKTKIAELSNLLGVNERMVRNYRTELIQADIMIDSDRGPDGGYSLNRNSFLHIRNITKEELEALKFVITEQLSKDSMYAKTLEIALDKLRAARKIEMDEKRYMYFVHRSLPNYVSSEEKQKFLKLQQALHEQRKIQITYRSSQGELTKRVIEPYGFVHYNEFFYTVAKCNWKQELRVFKLSRIQDYLLTNERYKIPENFDVRAEFPKFGIMKEPLSIKLQIDPSYATIIGESIWGEQQTITTQPDGSIHFEATMSGKESIKKWIRSMGTNAKVLEPKSLRDEMIKEMREQLKMYGE